MLLRPVHAARILASGENTGTLEFPSRMLGQVSISTDGSTAAVVTLQKDNSSGEEVFGISTKTPMIIHGPMLLGQDKPTNVGYFSVTGSGAEARFWEWVE